jgi:hypothetical protein
VKKLSTVRTTPEEYFVSHFDERALFPNPEYIVIFGWDA